MKRHVKTAFKIGITVLGLVFVWRQIPLGDIEEAFRFLNWSWVLFGVLLIIVSFVVRAYRWHLLLVGGGATVPFGRLVRLYFIGAFFNSFLPSGFGGDLVRAVEATQDLTADMAAGTVIVDRLTGLMGLFLLALFALPFSGGMIVVEWQMGVGLLAVGGLFGGWLLLDGRLWQLINQYLPERFSFADRLVGRIMLVIQGCGWNAVGKALAVSLPFNLMLAGWWWAAGEALGLEVPYQYYLLVVPILSLVLLIPSIGGLGVSENVAPLLFVGIGLSGGEAVSLSLLVFLMLRIGGIFGAPVYLFSKRA